MHKLFVDSLLAHMKGVLAHFEASRGIDHRYQKGFAREALVKTAIEPWFGPNVSIGSGFVINAVTSMSDHTGSTSTECDNVIFWPDLMPNLILGGSGGPSLFPIEGVASVVEVKSKLTTAELRKALNSLPTATKLTMLSGTPASSPLGTRPGAIQYTRPFGCILAFESDVAYETLYQMLDENLDSWDIACVLGGNGGVFFVAADENGRRMEAVNFPQNDADDYLLTDFSVLIRDQIQQLRIARLAQAPSLRPYVSEIHLGPGPN